MYFALILNMCWTVQDVLSYMKLETTIYLLFLLLEYDFRLANNLVYIALTLTLTSLAGSRYLNFFLYSLVEIPAYIVCWIAMEK